MKKLILLIFIGAVSIFADDGEIVINLTTQSASVIEHGEVIMKGNISSGREGYETPVGRYQITQKDIKHRSSIYPKPKGGAWMPYMLRLSHTPMALHLGTLPGYPASHGCVRLEDGFAQKVYTWAKIGTHVRIIGKTPNKSSKKFFKKSVNITPKILKFYKDVDEISFSLSNIVVFDD